MAMFTYEVQTQTGVTLRGAVAADDQGAAQKVLEGLGLRILSVAPESPGQVLRRVRPVSSADFLAFNMQLAQLVSAGLPVEEGLRLIASDMRSGRLHDAVRAVAAELDRGRSLSDAFAAHASAFPPLYAKLVQAGVKTNNLPAMLVNLGRHLDLVAMLKNALWRAAAYPIVVFVGFTVVTAFIAIKILPEFVEIMKDFRTNLPSLTEFVLVVGPWVPVVAAAIILLGLLLGLAWGPLWRARIVSSPSDTLWWVPGFGPVLRHNLIARWCDALMLGVDAGLALPEALQLASEAVGSAYMSQDAAKIYDAVTAGRPVKDVTGLRVLPQTVLAAIQLGSDQNDLPRVLASLVEMHRQLAQQRTAIIPAVFMPIFMAMTAGFIMLVVVAMFLPLVKLIQSVSGS